MGALGSCWPVMDCGDETIKLAEIDISPWENMDRKINPTPQQWKPFRRRVLVSDLEIMANVGQVADARDRLAKLKRLLHLGKEYPKGADYFRTRLKAAFLKNMDEKDPEKIKQLIARGEFVTKELEALYFLRKYRALKHRYYEDDGK